MHKWLATLCIVLGVFAAFFAGAWAWFAAGFGAFSHGRGLNYLILLAAGPLSLLPAGIVGRKRPLIAAAWLLGGSLFFYFWHLGFRQDSDSWIPLPGRAFESWLPIVLVCPAMSLLGAGFLSVGWPHVRAKAAGWWQSPVFRRRFSIIVATLAGAGTVVFGACQLMEPVWTITVTPEGQPSRSVRFNPKDHQNPREGPEKMRALEARLKDLFTPLFKDSDRTVLGTSEWKGTAAGGKSVWTIERKPGGLIRVLQNGAPIDQNWAYPDPTMDWIVRGAVRQIMEQSWREHAPPRNY